MRRNVIVIGASAGGVEALRALVAELPADLPASVLVVLHVPPYGNSVLPAILTRSGPLPAHHAEQGESLRPGQIYVAPPDHHLIVGEGAAVLSRGPTENGHRPAVDVLFRSAARHAGPRVAGVVLSGVLDDGTAGLAAIAGRGGATLVQDPEEALYDAMPANALAAVAADHVAPAATLGKLLGRVAEEELPDVLVMPPSGLLRMETDLARMDDAAMNEPDRPGEPSGYSCPDCNGVLFEIRDGVLVRYRCRVGHAWSPESLYGEQSQQLDGALWMALRGLEEKAAMARALGERAVTRNHTITARRFAEQADEATRAATLIRSMLEAQAGIHRPPAADEPI